MAFESFEDLARAGLKRVSMGPTRVLVKSEVSIKGRTQTLFRFSDDLIEKAGWTAGKDRITLSIDRTDLAIRARRTLVGGYKLIANGSARPYLKFTAARGMPIADAPSESIDVVVVGGEILFTLPDGVRLAS